jgi:uncharacterized protein
MRFAKLTTSYNYNWVAWQAGHTALSLAFLAFHGSLNLTKPNLFFVLAGLLALPASLYAAGFDCAKAGTATEKAVCADHQLSDLDGRLAAAYEKALIDKSRAASVKTAQKEWLKSVRDACQNKACLEKAYTSRLAQLEGKGFMPGLASILGISGTYQRYAQGKPDKDSSSITLRELSDGQIHVEGNATWVGDMATGNVNTGELDGTFKREGNAIHYSSDGDEGCKLTIQWVKNSLNVSDDNGRCGGLNVTFDGQYRKIRQTE